METQAEVRYDSSVIIGYNIGSVMMESGTCEYPRRTQGQRLVGHREEAVS